jgi:hypothetical protein
MARMQNGGSGPELSDRALPTCVKMDSAAQNTVEQQHHQKPRTREALRHPACHPQALCSRSQRTPAPGPGEAARRHLHQGTSSPALGDLHQVYSWREVGDSVGYVDPDEGSSGVSADPSLRSHELATRIWSGRVNRMCDHVTGEIMP